MNLAQLRHQIVTGVQSTGGVDNHDIATAGDTRIDGVKRDRRGIGPRRAPNELDARALRPDAQLIDRTRAKRVGRTEQHFLPIRAELRRQLADERCLAGTIHTNDQQNGRATRCAMQCRVGVAASERRFHAVRECIAELIIGLHLAALCQPFHFGNQRERRGDPEIGLDEQRLECLQRTLIDATAQQYANIGSYDILDALPERALGKVVLLAKQSGHDGRRETGDGRRETRSWGQLLVSYLSPTTRRITHSPHNSRRATTKGHQ